MEQSLRPDSLAWLLIDHPAGPDEPLVGTIEREMTASEFKRAAGSVAADLIELGVQRGQGVAVQSSSGLELAAAMFGVWLAGAVVIPVSARQPAREVDSVLSAVRPAALLAADGLTRLAEPVTSDADIAFVMWTSGTTGAPKPILQAHSAYREILQRVMGSLRTKSAPDRPSPNLVPVSLALNAGIYNFLFGLMAGATVVLMERFDPEDFAVLVARYGVRSTVLPPAAMTMLTDCAGVTSLSPLKYVRSITAPLSPLAAQRFMAKFGVTVLNGYGQAEIGEVIGWTAADARQHLEKLGAAGRPHPGVRIKVVDDDDRPVAPGTPGQLLVRPPRMAAGYAGGESLGERLDQEGFLRTGDYVVVDDDGFVWIEGRQTDVINRGGHKVFPAQVEEVLLLLPGIKDAAVVGVPDERLGELPVAFVVGDASDDELVAVCRQNLVPYKIPVAYERLAVLPRSEVGKVLRRQLAEDWTRDRG